MWSQRSFYEKEEVEGEKMTKEYLGLGELNMMFSKVIGVGSIEGLKVMYSSDGRAIGIIGEGLKSVQELIHLAFEEMEDKKDYQEDDETTYCPNCLFETVSIRRGRMQFDCEKCGHDKSFSDYLLWSFSKEGRSYRKSLDRWLGTEFELRRVKDDGTGKT